ncbi:MAG: hypothetical protein LBN37_07480 [Bacteroidales bacterium]|jgi:hypothetical protein|nr:hypothetical protein [Bacteroidales bacterium]
MKKVFIGFILILVMISCAEQSKNAVITQQAIDKAVAGLVSDGQSDKQSIEKGVKQVARLWQAQDGSEDEFIRFCAENYIALPDEKQAVFLKISDYMEAISGHFNEMSLQLQRQVEEATGELHRIDEMFSAYNPGTHINDDFYENKLAFIIALNFPQLSLAEKENLGNDRLAWAYARLGGMFTARIPANVQQTASAANNEAEVYISQYNIYAGHLLNREGKTIFPEDMVLLAHWNMRDEIKANYNKGEAGFDKQQTIYEAMKRIIAQEIPTAAINSGAVDWNPFTNTVYQSGNEVNTSPEGLVRYEKILKQFKAAQTVDAYTGNTYIDRNFSESMEISLEDTEILLRNYLTAPELKEVGKIIADRLGRNLEAFDIWYDGFKTRSRLDEQKLTEQTSRLYPDAAAFERQMPAILRKLGFSAERATYLADRIEVDAARGSGHAWGASMKGQKAHLRTRIPKEGMDYKGYNIAIHEFGHNVEQTLSLYDVDYYMMNGVPNTAFTEALAFVFQQRDLALLGIETNYETSADKDKADILDKAWRLYEISGVSLVEMEYWKWLYAHPDATAAQLKETVIRVAKEVWNTYYAPVFGIRDETVLAVYSHTVEYPLYLSAYAFGQIIEFQLEEYLNGKDFATEVDRIFRLGRLTPNQWMLQATGQPLSAEPLLEKLRATAL